MQDTASLNCIYIDYSAGRLEKKKFEEMIFTAILRKIPRMRGFGKEDYEDFISWLYPRISRAVDNYHKAGSSFEAYIYTLIHMAAKEYRQRQIYDYNVETAAWVTQLPDLYAAEMESDYSEHFEIGNAQIAEVSKKAKDTRQFLILVLKCCMHVSDDFLEKISRKTEIKIEALRAMINVLKESRKKREARIHALYRMANYQLCRCLLFERALRSANNNPVIAQRIKARLDRSKAKLDKAREQLAKLSPAPSNAQIAKLLGVTKGAVDSSLYAFKAKLGRNQSKYMLN